MSDDPRAGGAPAGSRNGGAPQGDPGAWFSPALGLAGIAVVLAVFALVLLNAAMNEFNTAAQRTERALTGIEERLAGDDILEGFAAIVASLDAIAERLPVAAPGAPLDLVSGRASAPLDGAEGAGPDARNPYVGEAMRFLEGAAGMDLASLKQEFVEGVASGLGEGVGATVIDAVRATAGMAYDIAACGVSDAYCPRTDRMALLSIADRLKGLGDLGPSLARLEAKLADPAAIEGLAALPGAVAEMAAAISAIEQSLASAGAGLDAGLAGAKAGLDGVAEALSRIERGLPAAGASLDARIGAVAAAIDEVNAALDDAAERIGGHLGALGDTVRETGTAMDLTDKEGVETVQSELVKIETVLSSMKDQLPAGPAEGPRTDAFEALLTVHFDSNSDEDDGSLQDFIIPQIARMTQSRTSCRMLVMGHTDTVGSDPANYALAERRAEAVIDSLKAAFDAYPVERAAWGERHLAVPTDDRIDSLPNRRVDINLKCEPEYGDRRAGR